MKTPNDPRHVKRKQLVQELFSVDFHQQKVSKKAQEILVNKEIINTYITKAAPEFPINKINKVDLAIMRLAVYELLIEKKEPTNVILDEAIELAKEFAGETSPAFINGALGNVIKYENSTKI